MGAITESVRRHMPATYRAMIGPTERTDYYSLTDLQALVEYVEFRLYATVVGVTQEASLYNPRQIDFIGKVASLRFIPAAIDYWMDQAEQITTHGPEETENFPARIAHLQALYKRLAEDVADEWDEVVGSKGIANSTPDVSYGDNGRGILSTPDPACFPPVIRRTHRNGIVPSFDHFMDGWG